MKIECRHIINEWLFLSIISYIFYSILWFLVDKGAYEDDVAWYYYIIDFLYCAVFCGCIKLVSHGIYALFRKELNDLKYFTITAICCFLTNLSLAFLFEKTMDAVFEQGSTKIMTSGVYVLTLIATFITLITLVYEHYTLYAEQLSRNKQLELNLLKRQLDPHFMFNNLSTLSGMVGTENPQAQSFIIKLSHVYRYITCHVTDDVVTISEAIAFIKNYNDLLEIRHPKHFTIDVSPELENCKDYILPLSLQLLTENAIKHNKHSADNPLYINYRKEGEYLIVCNLLNVNNSPKESANVGLENLQKRYLLFCNRDCIINKTEKLFEVKIPIIKRNEYESINH